MNKEKHANFIQEIISQYFMTQRIKPVADKKLKSYKRYIKNLSLFKKLNRPLLLGPSLKSFIGQILGIEVPAKRDIGTLGVVVFATLAGADIIRVHAVKEAKEAITVVKAIIQS